MSFPASCIDFGSSGSGFVRRYKKYATRTETTDPANQTPWVPNLPSYTRTADYYQYSFAGPLSMSKGCDEAIEVSAGRDSSGTLREYIYRGSNVAVVTDTTCYMDWIAEEYNMRLDYQYDKSTCSKTFGNKNDINRQDIPCR